MFERLGLAQNMPLKLLSLAIGCVLWFAVLGSRNVEVSKEVPIEIITPPELIVANEVPDKVAFRLSGPKAFLRNILNRKEEPIHVNFSSASAGFSTYRLFQDNIQVPIGVKVLSVNPASIVVKLEPLKRRDIAVKLVTKGEVSPGYTITRMELMDRTVRLRGPDAKLSQLNEVLTIPLNLAEQFESGTREVSLDLSDLPGVILEGPPPKLHLEVTQTTANFKIRNADVKVLTNRKFKVDPKDVVIYVKCSPEELRQVNRSKVFAQVDLRNKGVGVYEENVQVQLPTNIKMMKVVPQKVKVTIY